MRSRSKSRIAKLEANSGFAGGLFWFNIGNSRFKIVEANLEISVQSSTYGL